MKLALLTTSVSRMAGGIYEAIRRLAQTLEQEQDLHVHVFGLEDGNTDTDIYAWLPLKPIVFQARRPRFIGYAPNMYKALVKLEPDISHTHGLWMYPSEVTRKWGVKTKKPYMVTPHGMLDTWALQNSRWKKTLAGLIYESKHLKNAACLHSLCASETKAIRQYGLQNPICQIPNGIDLPLEQHLSKPPWDGKVEKGIKVLLYLGRIHPKKGLVNLLHAWYLLYKQHAKLTNDWELVIAGWDQLEHESELRKLAQELEIEKSVNFIGPQFGNNKQAAYQNADAFILPSFSEGLPMVVLEAWSHSLPVIVTPECNLPECFQANAAIKVFTNQDSIKEGLYQLFTMSNNERIEMGTKGLALVKGRFNWSEIAADMHSVYEWILGGGTPPSCVVIK